MNKPKPCPWCGWSGDSIYVQKGTTFRCMLAVCPDCGAAPGEDRVAELVPAGQPLDTPANYAVALETWNTRATDAEWLSRAMFIARIQNTPKATFSVAEIMALINDCDMLATRQGK